MKEIDIGKDEQENMRRDLKKRLKHTYKIERKEIKRGRGNMQKELHSNSSEEKINTNQTETHTHARARKLESNIHDKARP